MGVINKSTAEINALLDKVESMPEEGVVGKTPVIETGSTTTLDPGQSATSEVVSNGTDESGNPKYKINLGIPRGYDGSGTGGGGVADSVQWSNVLNKPTWVNSPTKPTYTAAEVGALPSTTTIPGNTSQLTNDSGFVKSTELKTINGNSIVGSGNIEISGGSTGGGSGNGNVNVSNAPTLKKDSGYIFHPSEDGSLTGEFKTIPSASKSNSGLMDSEMFHKVDMLPPILNFTTDFGNLNENSTSDEIFSVINASFKSMLQTEDDLTKEGVWYILSVLAAQFETEYSNDPPYKYYIGRNAFTMVLLTQSRTHQPVSILIS